MSKAEYTPGPWAIAVWAAQHERAGEVASVFAVDEDGEDGDTICDIDTFCEPPEREANARLIAASPTLYDYVQSKALGGCENAKKILARAGLS